MHLFYVHIICQNQKNLCECVSEFILGLLLFLDKWNQNKNVFTMWGQSDPKDLNGNFFFFHTPLEQPNQAQIFLCACLE